MAEDSTPKQGKNRPRSDHDVSHLAQNDTENEYDKITDEQRRMVDLSQKLPENVQKWIKEQQKYVKDLQV